MKCYCGQELHYENKEIEQRVNEMCELLGQYMQVNVDGKLYNVPRHYAALHGVKDKDLATLGFQEIQV